MKKNSHFILGVRVDNLSLKEILEYIKKSKVQSPKSKVKKARVLQIATINPEFVILAQEDPSFKRVINRAWLCIPDGIGILLSGALKGQRFKERTTGLRLMEELCRMASKEGLTIGLIGGRGKVAVKAFNCLKKKYPGISGWAEEGPLIQIKNEKLKMKNYNLKLKMQEFLPKTDLLFVAMGAPKQEFFIDALNKHLEKSDKSLKEHTIIAIGVGGAFDEISEKVRPSPDWIDKIGFKWLWRLVWQPWRWRRQTRLFKFFWKILISSALKKQR